MSVAGSTPSPVGGALSGTMHLNAIPKEEMGIITINGRRYRVSIESENVKPASALSQDQKDTVLSRAHAIGLKHIGAGATPKHIEVSRDETLIDGVKSPIDQRSFIGQQHADALNAEYSLTGRASILPTDSTTDLFNAALVAACVKQAAPLLAPSPLSTHAAAGTLTPRPVTSPVPAPARRAAHAPGHSGSGRVRGGGGRPLTPGGTVAAVPRTPTPHREASPATPPARHAAHFQAAPIPQHRPAQPIIVPGSAWGLVAGTPTPQPRVPLAIGQPASFRPDSAFRPASRNVWAEGLEVGSPAHLEERMGFEGARIHLSPASSAAPSPRPASRASATSQESLDAPSVPTTPRRLPSTFPQHLLIGNSDTDAILIASHEGRIGSEPLFDVIDTLLTEADGTIAGLIAQTASRETTRRLDVPVRRDSPNIEDMHGGAAPARSIRSDIAGIGTGYEGDAIDGELAAIDEGEDESPPEQGGASPDTWDGFEWVHPEINPDAALERRSTHDSDFRSVQNGSLTVDDAESRHPLPTNQEELIAEMQDLNDRINQYFAALQEEGRLPSDWEPRLVFDFENRDLREGIEEEALVSTDDLSSYAVQLREFHESIEVEVLDLLKNIPREITLYYQVLIVKKGSSDSTPPSEHAAPAFSLTESVLSGAVVPAVADETRSLPSGGDTGSGADTPLSRAGGTPLRAEVPTERTVSRMASPARLVSPGTVEGHAAVLEAAGTANADLGVSGSPDDMSGAHFAADGTLVTANIADVASLRNHMTTPTGEENALAIEIGV